MCTAPLKNMTGSGKTGFFGLSHSDQNFWLTATGHLLKAQGKLIFLKEIILVNASERKILYNTKQTKCHTQYPSWWKGWDQLCGVSLSIRREAWKQREKKPARQCSCHPQKLINKKGCGINVLASLLRQKDRNPTF